jgi:ankyrin repeat protein
MSLNKLRTVLNNKVLDMLYQVQIENFTPLHWGANNGDSQIVTALLKANADVNAKTYYKGKELYSPLYVAEQLNHSEIVKLLKDHEAKDSIQSAFLHYGSLYVFS